MAMPNQPHQISLLPEVTCPHCWHKFKSYDTLWIARHPDLIDDPRLGKNEPRRFAPKRFTVDCRAIDEKGVLCTQLACPRCHLEVPRAAFEMKAVYWSILGPPGCGKTYFLASMTRMLEDQCSKEFALSFKDADPVMNGVLNKHKQRLFESVSAGKVVVIDKTQERGEGTTSTIMLDGRNVTYPCPFVFTLKPLGHHPVAATVEPHMLCLYDNAGEDFLPGADRVDNESAGHLAKSDVLMYLFDPTQDPQFRSACLKKTPTTRN